MHSFIRYLLGPTTYKYIDTVIRGKGTTVEKVGVILASQSSNKKNSLFIWESVPSWVLQRKSIKLMPSVDKFK